MYEKLKGKVVLVTGASGDIGGACAEAFVQHGAILILHSHKNKEGVEKIIKKYKQANIFHINCDATNEEEVQEQFQIIKNKFKIKKIDVLVNNAGDLISRTPLGEMDLELIQKVFDVNVKSAFLFTRFSISLMPRNSSIIFISSLTARSGKGDRSSAYSMAKGALISWSKSLADELGPKGVRVNCITPGYIQGRFHKKYTPSEVEMAHRDKNPLKRLGRPHDVAMAVLFYAANSDGYISGTTLDVCGADYMC